MNESFEVSEDVQLRLTDSSISTFELSVESVLVLFKQPGSVDDHQSLGKKRADSTQVNPHCKQKVIRRTCIWGTRRT